jgi:hypothetical protein
VIASVLRKERFQIQNFIPQPKQTMRDWENAIEFDYKDD